MSPAVGRLDAAALTEQMRDDGDAALALLADLAIATDPALRRQARTVAEQLLPRLGRLGLPVRRGTRRLVARAGVAEGDVDLERTLERSAGRRPRDRREVVSRQFGASPRALCLLVDRSGSMSGHAVALASVAAAAVVSARGERMHCSVVAFASEPLILLAHDSPRPVAAVIDDLLSLRGHGRTDLARALRVATEELDHVPPGGRTALLLSDALATKGADPLPAAGLLDCLHVLGTTATPDSVDAGRALARRGRGRYLGATTLAELTNSLQAVLG